LLAALMSFAPSLLSKLFGGDPQRKLRQQIQALVSPASVGRLTGQFYQQALGSPAFAQGQRQIAAGANLASADVARNLAARGIGTTGTAAVLSGLTPSLVGAQQAGLRTAAQQTAQQQAQQSIQQQIAALTGTAGPSQTQQLFGVGLEAFIPYLMQLLQGGQGLPY